jgi:hypothetical protein
MAVEFWAGRQKYDTTHENRSRLEIMRSFQDAFGLGDEGVFVVFNFYVDGCDIDAAVFRNNAVAVIEVKESPSPIEANHNGPWYYLDAKKSEIGGKDRESPFEQAKRYRFGLMKFLKKAAPTFLSSQKASVIDFSDVNAVVTISPTLLRGSKKNFPPTLIWFHVTGLDTLAREVSTIRARSFSLEESEIRKFITTVLKCTPVPDAPTLPPPAIGYFSCDRTSIQPGEASTLSWSTTSASSVTIQPDIGEVHAQGTREVGRTSSATYTLTASGPGGPPAIAKITITVLAEKATAQPQPENDASERSERVASHDDSSCPVESHCFDEPKQPQFVEPIHPPPKSIGTGTWVILAVIVLGVGLYLIVPKIERGTLTANPGSGATGVGGASGAAGGSKNPGPDKRPDKNTGESTVQVMESAQKSPEFATFVNRHVSLSSSQRNVALVIDTHGQANPTPVGDLLGGFLGDKNVRTILNLVDVRGLKANGFFEDFYAGNRDLIREAIRLSGVDYVLLGEAEYQFRKQPALDPDLITCDLTVKSRLADRRGTIIQSAVFSAPGPGFTEAQAIERAAENIAQQLSKKFFETLQ